MKNMKLTVCIQNPNKNHAAQARYQQLIKKLAVIMAKYAKVLHVDPTKM